MKTLLLFGLAAVLAGCARYQPGYGAPYQANRVRIGTVVAVRPIAIRSQSTAGDAVVGGLLGAGIGALLHNTNGALVGGALGAVGGGVVGANSTIPGQLVTIRTTHGALLAIPLPDRRQGPLYLPGMRIEMIQNARITRIIILGAP